MNLVSLLIERARQHPEQPALIDQWRGRDRVVTFGELVQQVAAGARVFQQLGLERGQVVLLFQPVSIELYELLLASLHAGLRVMLADPSAGREFLTLCCERLPPAAFCGSWAAHWLRLGVPALRRIRPTVVTHRWFPTAHVWRPANANGAATMCEVTDDEPALITFTTGSTGVPKATVRTHRFLLAQHRALAASLELKAGEVDLITLPVFVLANLASGLTSVLAATDLAHPGAPAAAAIRQQCQRHQVTRCTASPAFFEGFLRAACGLPPWRKVFTGGAPVFPDLLERLAAALPNSEIHAVYGSTEAEPIAELPADEAGLGTVAITRRGGGLCAGLAVPQIRLQILTDRWGQPLGPLNAAEFSKLAVAHGEAGEIVVSGDHVLGGYLDGLGDSETKIRVDDQIWHRTGDAGWLDANGRLWLLGRCAEKLPAMAWQTGLPAEALRYPFAIECALRSSFPMLRTAAINWHGQPVLVVGSRERSQQTEALESLARQFGIQEVVYLPKLPLDRRHNAKIDYRALRAALSRVLPGSRP